MQLSISKLPSIHYVVTPLIERNVFAIEMSITSNNPAGFEIYLPNWIAGSYMLRDFARHIINIRAVKHKHQEVTLTALNQYTWHVAASGRITVHYEIYAHDISVRTAFLDNTGGFFNGTSLFLSIKRFEQNRHHLTLRAPHQHQDWQVATTLSRTGKTKLHSFGEYVARNYDELVDHPVRFGHLTWLQFTAHNAVHEIAIAGHVPYLDKKTLVHDLQTICQAQISLFGAPAPFKRYLFMIDARNDGYGGLEHRDSTALLCQRDHLPGYNDGIERGEDYLNFLGLCSHEYFHSWNVKRIKPTSFVHYDFTQTIDTSLLWFFEGVTDYYDDLILVRTGILSETQYLQRLESTINNVLRYDGCRVQTVNDSGWYAWSKYYQPSPNTANSVVSYYAKGSLIALTIDLFIRQHSYHQFSLDNVMCDLWRQFGHNFYKSPQGITLENIISTCEQYATNIRPLILKALYTTDELPLHDLFAAHGFALSLPQTTLPQLGASVKKVNDTYQILRVFNYSAAQQAGLAPDDILLSFDAIKINTAPDDMLNRIPVGQKITVHYFRDGVLHHTTLINQAAFHGVYNLKRMAN